MKIKKLKGERWSKIPMQGYTGYSVSSCGRVYSHKTNRVMYASVNSGYSRVYLSYMGRDTGFYVHKLVAKAFIENPKGYLLVNHKDSNRANNNVSNLEWCNNDMNIKHAVDNKRFNKIEGEKVITSKLNATEVIEIRALFVAGFTRRQIAEKYHTKPSNVKDIVLRRSWKHI